MNARITKGLGCHGQSPYGKPFARNFEISSSRGCNAPFLGCLIYQIISELWFAIRFNYEEDADVQAVQFEVKGEDPIFSQSTRAAFSCSGVGQFNDASSRLERTI